MLGTGKKSSRGDGIRCPNGGEERGSREGVSPDDFFLSSFFLLWLPRLDKPDGRGERFLVGCLHDRIFARQEGRWTALSTCVVLDPFGVSARTGFTS